MLTVPDAALLDGVRGQQLFPGQPCPRATVASIAMSTRESSLQTGPPPQRPRPASGWEKAIRGLLAQAEEASDGAQRIERLGRAADIYETQLNDPRKAFAVWQAAFAADFSQPRPAEALERLAERLGAGPALFAHFQPMVAEAGTARERASLLAWLGRWLARFTQDFPSAEQYLVEALRLDPTCLVATRTLRALASHAGRSEDMADTPPPSVGRASRPITLPRLEPVDSGPPSSLQGRLDGVVAAGRWADAVPLLLELASAADPSLRAKYLAAAGKVLHYKLGRDEEAVQMFDQALEACPAADLKVFERLYRILVRHQAWRQAETRLGRMIGRIEVAHGGNKEQALEALWRRLGDVYRLGLKDLPAAARAYQVCARLAPGNRWYPQILSEMASGKIG
jgi:tetratricopeptide (TPR) repeat protein